MMNFVSNFSYMKSHVIALLLSTTFFASSISYGQNSTLPELGDSSTRYLSSRQELDIGKQFQRQLLAASNYIDDAQLRYYLNNLGRNIAASVDLLGTTLYFNLLQDSELNAFAAPGGFITFHSGLILATESESELASVVSHEIAHLSQRHLPRMLAKAEASKLPTAAAIIAAILVGGQAGIAGVTLANANLISKQLAYSRDFEREADAIGIKMMASSGFDPQGMGKFFNKLQRFNLVTNKDVPEFLRTHPLSYTRIAEAEARLAAYPAQQHQSSIDFLLARARVRALYSERAKEATEFLRNLAGTTTGAEKDAATYGVALAEMRTRQYSDALTTLEGVSARHANLPQVLMARAEILIAADQPQKALEVMNAAISAHPSLPYLDYFHLESLLAAGDAEEARKMARYLLRRHPDAFRLYRPLSRAHVALGELSEAHQADAEYLAAIGRYRSAIKSLKLALRDNAENSQYINQSLKSRLTELERLDSARKKRNNG